MTNRAKNTRRRRKRPKVKEKRAFNPELSGPVSEVLHRCLELLAPLKQVLPTWQTKFEILLREVDAGRLRIGVVGITSSGKSTFINGLLGKEILPEQSKATTNLPVICRYGSRPQLSVVYPDDKVEVFVDAEVTPSLVKSFCSEDENPGNIKHVWRLELELPSCCLPRDLEVIDTPGTDAYGLEEHEQVTLCRCLPIADIVVFMTHSRHARLTLSEGELLSKVIENDQRVLFVISCSDGIKQETENGRVIMTREDKLVNLVREMELSIRNYPRLKDGGIVAVSSLWAREACADRTHPRWQQSNFERVIEALANFRMDLAENLSATRLDRARALIVSLVSAIQQVPGTLKHRATATFEEQELVQQLDRLAQAEMQLTRRLDDLVRSIKEATNPGRLAAHGKSMLFKSCGSDISAVRRLIMKIRDNWRSVSDEQIIALQSFRLEGRRELTAVNLAPSRESFRNRMLHLESFPSVSDHIVEHTSTHEVAVPRTSFFGMFADWLWGVRKERKTTTSESVDIEALNRSIESFFDDSCQQFMELVAEQSEVLSETYLEPIRKRLDSDNCCLEEMKSLRRLAADQLCRLPQIAKQLQEVLNTGLPASQPSKRPVCSLRSAFSTLGKQVTAFDSLKSPPYAALPTIVQRFWQTAALKGFWDSV